jgi:hypothetical protein
MEESKLSVPNSRVYFLESDQGMDSWSSGLVSDPTLLLLPDLFGGSGACVAGAEGAAEAAAGGGEGVAEGILGGIDIL